MPQRVEDRGVEEVEIWEVRKALSVSSPFLSVRLQNRSEHVESGSDRDNSPELRLTNELQRRFPAPLALSMSPQRETDRE